MIYKYQYNTTKIIVSDEKEQQLSSFCNAFSIVKEANVYIINYFNQFYTACINITFLN